MESGRHILLFCAYINAVNYFRNDIELVWLYRNHVNGWTLDVWILGANSDKNWWISDRFFRIKNSDESIQNDFHRLADSNRKCITVQHPPSAAYSNSLARWEVQWNRTFVSIPRIYAHTAQSAHISELCISNELWTRRADDSNQKKAIPNHTVWPTCSSMRRANAITIGTIAIGHCLTEHLSVLHRCWLLVLFNLNTVKISRYTKIIYLTYIIGFQYGRCLLQFLYCCALLYILHLYRWIFMFIYYIYKYRILPLLDFVFGLSSFHWVKIENWPNTILAQAALK